MKIYICTAESKSAFPEDDGTFKVVEETRTFSNLQKAYRFACQYVGVPSGITPSYATLTRKMKQQPYFPISGRRYADDAELPNYFLTHNCRVGIMLREVE